MNSNAARSRPTATTNSSIRKSREKKVVRTPEKSHTAGLANNSRKRHQRSKLSSVNNKKVT
jgi:hypothetical protein